MLEAIKTAVEKIVATYVRDKKIDVVDMTIQPHGRTIVIQILADKEGKISVDECASMNRFVSEEIEAQNIMDQAYTVEVSSPGLDRPLTTLKDFSRVTGKDIRVHLFDKIEGKCEHQGRVEALEGDNIILKTSQHTFALPIQKISKAIQII